MNKTYTINGTIDKASGFGWFNDIMINHSTYTATLNISGDDTIESSFQGNIKYTITLNSFMSKGFDVTDKVIVMLNGLKSFLASKDLNGPVINETINQQETTGFYNISISPDWKVIKINSVVKSNKTAIETNAVGILT